MNRALQTGSNISQMNCSCGANGHLHIGVRLFSRLNAIYPVLLIFGHRSIRTAFELGVGHLIIRAANFELPALAEQHLAFSAIEFRPAIDVERIGRRPESLFINEQPATAYLVVAWIF